MFRRCVSILVIAGFLASQLAAIPHAHAGASAEEQRQHDATPHFHCGLLGHAGHDHGHSHSGHSHSHPRQRIEEGTTPKSIDLDCQPLATGLGGADHDADAIFVPEPSGVVSISSHNDQAASAGQLAALAALPECRGLQASQSLSRRWDPPDQVLDASDTYLTLRNLRI